ncbi:MAG: CBS domain-containing protein, partial [Proteobacteria bacterium]|nr:CBS domain-containing protein [Pseudomonadota bacterium]
MALTAADIMTRNPVSVGPRASLAEIATLLAEKRISGVPVCDADGTLLGVVSEGDVIKPFRASAQAKHDWWADAVARGEILSREFMDYVTRDGRSAADIMVPHVITATEDAPLPQIAELMMRHAVKRVPILRGMKVVGIV